MSKGPKGKGKMIVLRPSRISLKDVDPSRSLAKSLITDPLALRKHQQSVWSDHLFTHNTAYRMIRNARKECPEKSSETAIALASNSALVSGLHRKDALEEAREAMGLDELRERIVSSMLKSASYSKGRKMLENALEKAISRPLAEGELDEILPDITSLEITLLSLLKRVPGCYLQNMELVHVHNITVDGIEYAGDDFDEISDDRDEFRERPLDPYAGGGLTGIHDQKEFVPFKDSIRKNVEKLIYLTISNRKLHERLFRSNSGNLPVCFGLLMREAYSQVTETGHRTQNTGHKTKYTGHKTKYTGHKTQYTGHKTQYTGHRTPIPHASNLVGTLSDEDAKRFYEIYEKLQQSLAGAILHDIALGRTLDEYDTFRLVSLLERVPRPFLEQEQFTGYAVPYGLGVLFIGQDGSEQDHVPYRKLFATDAVHTIYYEREDISKYNETAHRIFSSFVEILSLRIEKSQAQGRIPLSAAEEAWMECFTELGIDLAIRPERSFENIEKDVEAKTVATAGAVAGDVRSISGAKFGAEESRHIVRILKLLPKELLLDVKSIAKRKRSFFLIEQLMSGFERVGFYMPESKRIILHEDPNNPYSSYSRMEKYVYSETILHEVGESIWANLPQEEKDRFAAITGWKQDGCFWKRPMDAPIADHFLTFYSHSAKNPGDDFSEHFAIYVMHGKEFRETGERHEPLKRKYAFIREIFTPEGGQSLEYPQISDMGIREVHGELQKEVKRRSMEEAKKAMDAMDERMYVDRRDYIASIKKSWESMQEDEYAREDSLEEQNNPFFGSYRKKMW